MSYKQKYEHALDRFTSVCKDMFTELELLKQENDRLTGGYKCAERAIVLAVVASVYGDEIDEGLLG